MPDRGKAVKDNFTVRRRVREETISTEDTRLQSASGFANEFSVRTPNSIPRSRVFRNIGMMQDDIPCCSLRKKKKRANQKEYTPHHADLAPLGVTDTGLEPPALGGLLLRVSATAVDEVPVRGDELLATVVGLSLLSAAAGLFFLGSGSSSLMDVVL